MAAKFKNSGNHSANNNSGNDNIGPTAHYTGYVWTRHGLSHPLLATVSGRLYFRAAQPVNALASLCGQTSLEGLLLARHRVIDALLAEAIDAGRITQVIELAAGLSPRGWRFAERYGQNLTYIETDLPDMAARKRRLLARMGAQPRRHRIEALDVLDGRAVDSLVRQCKRRQGLAIISEGLLNYLPQPAVTDLWTHIGTHLREFRHGLYLSDLHIGGDNRDLLGRGFVRLLSAFVRGRVQLHFNDAAEANLALMEAGFTAAQLHHPADLLDDASKAERAASRRVRIIQAHT